MTKLPKSNFLKLCRVLSLTLVLSSTVSNVAAESESFYQFPTGEQEGGGVRGVKASCGANDTYPIPLVPQNYQTVTASASPKLFFDASHINYPVVLDFLMLDENDEIVYQHVLEADRHSSIVSLDLAPESSDKQLEIDNYYHWYLVENCSDRSIPNIFAAGSLKRIELQTELAQKLANASTFERANLYREANMWHEAVENIAQLQCNLTDVSFASKITEVVNNSAQLIDNFNSNECLAAK